MYTVFTPSGAPKRNQLGLTVFVRTLAAAREACAVGEWVQQWGPAGQPRSRWARQDDGKFRKIA